MERFVAVVGYYVVRNVGLERKLQTQQKEMKMDREKFTEELCERILAALGDEYRTELSGVRKNNGVMKDAIYVSKENSECMPCFYADELYHSYCNGEPVEGLAEHIVNIVLNECEEVRRESRKYLETEWIREHMFVRLVEFEKNQEWLEDAVYVTYLDLVAVVYVLTEDCEDGVKSFLLPKHMWPPAAGTPEEYFPVLMENTRRLFPEKLWRIENTVRKCDTGWEAFFKITEEKEETLSNNQLYVLSNYRKINGAAVVLYPELLKQVYERFSGNYFVIPSSVHEVLLLKETGEEEEEAYYNRMVSEVNENHVEPEEVLSEHVYYYSGEKGLCKIRAEGRIE